MASSGVAVTFFLGPRPLPECHASRYGLDVAVVSAALIVLLCACGLSPGGATSYRIASASVKGDAINMAGLFGVLQGRSNSDGTACLWVGHGSEARALTWPYGYTAGGSPLTVYDDTGVGVAVVGQRVTFAGGLLPGYVHSILGCQGLTKFWGVGRVEEARWN